MRPLKFRCWNGEQMVSPDFINREGTAYWSENSITQLSKDIMQFTGLLDRNGQEIWEGDTVSLSDPDTRTEVKWRDGAFRILSDSPLCQDRARKWEVIGNIYESPEGVK